MNIIQKLVLTSIIVGVLGTIPGALAAETYVSIPSGSSTAGCEEANRCYIPFKVTVNPEDVVTWTNDDTATHTVTSGNSHGGPDGFFNSGLIIAGTEFSHAFDTAGEYDYYCLVHPWMEGQVLVTEGDKGEGSSTTTINPNTMTVGSTPEAQSLIKDLVAEITSSNTKANETMEISVTITDIEGKPVEHITYNIQAIQGTVVLLNEEGHMHQGTTTNTHTTKALPVDASDDIPVTITVSAVGFGHGEQYKEAFGQITSKKVVPEFGTITVMILAISIVSIIAITGKSKIGL